MNGGLAADRHVLLLGLSVLCGDVWSLRKFDRASRLNYTARANGLEAPNETVQLQFAARQSDLLESERRDDQRSYWQHRQAHKFHNLRLPLEEIPPSTQLRAKQPAQTYASEIKGARVKELERLANQQSVGVKATQALITDS